MRHTGPRGRAKGALTAIVAMTVAGALAAIAGCGISPQSEPTPIQAPAGVLRTPSPQPTVKPSGNVQETLYFVRDGALIRVSRRVSGPPATDSVIRDLLAGPNEQESADGLTSALLGDQVVQDVEITAGQAVVALATPVTDTARNDEVIAYAQIVCTLTAMPAVNGVMFTSGGQPTAVPRGDGSLSLNPLTAGDYADLIDHG